MSGGSKRHQQDVAIRALLTSPSITDAASQAGISERTLRRWLADPEFKRQYIAAKREIVFLAINRAQCRSLDQHGSRSPYETDILGISLAKGGSSVLADGYLVAGALSHAESEFLFGFGALLQFLDDLQDVCLDREAGHMTIFSQTAEGWPLDRITTRLLDFMDRILNSGAGRFDSPRCQSLWMAIRRNCTHLLLQAVATNRSLFTSELVKTFESHSPLPFASLRTLKRRAKRRHDRIKRAWAKQGVDLLVSELLA